MLNQKFLIINENGLDVKVTTVLVNTLSKFKSSIRFIVEGREADAKSIINLMALNIRYNQTLEVQVTGETHDANATMNTIIEILKEYKVIEE